MHFRYESGMRQQAAAILGAHAFHLWRSVGASSLQSHCRTSVASRRIKSSIILMAVRRSGPSGSCCAASTKPESSCANSFSSLTFGRSFIVGPHPSRQIMENLTLVRIAALDLCQRDHLKRTAHTAVGELHIRPAFMPTSRARWRVRHRRGIVVMLAGMQRHRNPRCCRQR